MLASSPQINELLTAFAKAQGEFPVIPKNKEVTVRNKENTRNLYSFKYADLTEIIDCTRPSLTKHALSFTQSLMDIEKLGLGFVTRIMHASGQWMDTGFIPATISNNAAMKDIAGLATYGKRLSLSEALGISADDDIDAPSESDEVIDVKPANEPRSSVVELKPKGGLMAHKDDVTKLLKAFSALGITQVQVLSLVGATGTYAITESDLEFLKRLGSDLKSGKVTKADVFQGQP
jgi:hypothetical protein